MRLTHFLFFCFFCKRFNPRTHEGCDYNKFLLYQHFKVSIHAPTRGATVGYMTGGKTLKVSIHAPTRGATQRPDDRYFEDNVSIHAPTRGATLLMGKICRALLFQSTHPRGVRHNDTAQGLITFAFQSTHPRGVRLGKGYL